MFIVFGTRVMKKLFGNTQVYQCGNCKNVNEFRVTRIMRWFTLFWIPIFPFFTTYFISCPVCDHGWETNKDEAFAQLSNKECAIES